MWEIIIDTIVSRDNSPVLLDRLQAQLYALASDPDTFLKDPDPADSTSSGGQVKNISPRKTSKLVLIFVNFQVPDYTTWQCDLVKRQGEISDLMMNNAHVRSHYTEQVPEKASHKQFWTRYFYKVHLIELQEARRQALRKRAEQAR